MNKVEWQEKYSTGVSLLDSGNRKLLDMINSLIETQNSAPEDSQAISSLLSQIQDLALTHFKNEEKYLININHKDYVDHKAEHTIFKKRLAFFCFERSNKSLEASLDEFCEFLVKWFIGHSLNSRESLTSTCDKAS